MGIAVKFLLLLLVHYGISKWHVGYDDSPSEVEEYSVDYSYPWGFKLNQTYDEYSSVFETYENKLMNEVCKTGMKSMEFLLDPTSHHFLECSSLNICNSTHCVIYWMDSTAFSSLEVRNDLTVLSNPVTANASNNYEVPTPPEFKTRITESVRTLYARSTDLNQLLQIKNFNNFNFSLVSNSIWDEMQDQYYSPIDLKSLLRRDGYSKHCELGHEDNRHLLIETNLNLPLGCFYVRISDGVNSYHYPLMSQLFAFVYERNFEECKLRKLTIKARSLRDVAYVHDRFFEDFPLPGSILPKRPKQNSIGLLTFNIPGYRYCGPGTVIEVMDDLGGPVNSLDEACRKHDLDYQMGIDPAIADRSFLNAVWEHSFEFYPIFAHVFESKLYFERATGRKYTSSLYFYPADFQPSLTMYFWRESVYNDLDANSTYLVQGLQLENRWMDNVKNIWQGHCSTNVFGLKAQKREGAELIGDTTPIDDNADNTEQSQQQSETQTPSQSTEPVIVPEDTSETTSYSGFEPAVAVKLPKPPKQFGFCRLLINEICTSNDEERYSSFIENALYCPIRKKNPKIQDLTGYIQLFIQAGPNPFILMVVDYVGQKLRTVNSETAGNQKVTMKMFTVGTMPTQPDISIMHPNVQIVEGERYVIPNAVGKSICVVLIHVTDYRNKKKQILKISMKKDRAGRNQRTELTEDGQNFITQNLQDAILIGQPCPKTDCDIFKNWLLVNSDVRTDAELVSAFDDWDSWNYPDQKPYKSINRCSTSTLPMQLNDFAHGTPTPNQINACPLATPSLNFPYGFRGTSLQSTSQQMALNLKYFFTEAKKDQSLLSDGPYELTAKALNIAPSTLARIQTNYDTGSVFTPHGRKRVRPNQSTTQMDSFRIDVFKRIIQGFYAKNQAPFLADVYKEFNEAMIADTEVLRASQTGQIRAWKCAPYTFRKVVHKLGFKFGKINLRDVILQRNDIVTWRGKYLRRIRANDASPNPKPVIYTDETWIDPFARTGKAWIPKKFNKFKDRKLYTFKTNKVGRGPRIIILHAGGNMGMIHEVMTVYQVSKKDTGQDYHDNVNSETYMKWFTSLMNALVGKGPHIIVCDNAPYHGKSEAPKSSDRKGVFYEWLQKNLEPQKLAELRSEKSYRRWELWDMVKNMKGTSNYFVIDKLARTYGHEIVRIPPYNCDLNPIEEVWKDIKDAVRKGNRDQNLATVTATTKEILSAYTIPYWQSHVRHIKRLEQQYWEEDGHYDDMYNSNQRIIIPLNEDEDDDDDDDDESDGDEDQAQDLPIQSVVHDYESLNDIEDVLSPAPELSQANSRRRLNFESDEQIESAVDILLPTPDTEDMGVEPLLDEEDVPEPRQGSSWLRSGPDRDETKRH